MNIAIIGGGIAGLSAATILQELGHKVTIFEKNKELGGLVRSTYDNLSNYRDYTPRVFFPNYYNFFNIMKRIPIYYQKRTTNKRLFDIFQKLDSNFIVSKYGLTRSGILKMAFNSKLTLIELFVLGITIVRYMFCCTQRLEDDADRVHVSKFVKNKDGKKRWEMLSLILGETLDVLPMHKLVRLVEQNLHPGKLKSIKGPHNEFLFINWELYLRQLGTVLVKDRSVERINREQTGRMSIYCNKGVFKDFTRVIIATDLWSMIKICENSRLPLQNHIYELAQKTKSNQMGINIYFPTNIKFKTKSVYALEDTDWKIIVEPKDNNWKYPKKDGLWTVCIPDDNLFSTRLQKKLKDCTPNEIYDEVWKQIYNSNIFENAETPKEQIIPSYFKIWEGWDTSTDTVKNNEFYFWNAVGTAGIRPDQYIGLNDIYLCGAYTKTSYYHYWVEGACESGLRVAKLIDYRVNIVKHERIKFLKLFHKLDKYLYDQYLPNIVDVSFILIVLFILYKNRKN